MFPVFCFVRLDATLSSQSPTYLRLVAPSVAQTELTESVSKFLFSLSLFGPRTDIYLKFGWQFFVIRYISDVQMKAEL